MLESHFKTDLKNELKALFPGCIILHLNPNEIQGIPDLLVLYKQHWATLEGKRSEHENHRPNQDYWVDKMNGMSFSSFIFPENHDEVIKQLTLFFNQD